MLRLIREFSPKQLEWRNDPRTRKFTRQSGILSLEEQDRWIRHAKEGSSDEIYFGLETEVGEWKGLRRQSTIVGYTGLSGFGQTAVRAHGCAEYSLLIGPEHQSKGYGKEGLKLILAYGFNVLDLYLIWGEIIEGNEGGLKTAMRVGFKEDGRLRERYFKDGKRVNSILVSITTSEFRNDGNPSDDHQS